MMVEKSSEYSTSKLPSSYALWSSVLVLLISVLSFSSSFFYKELKTDGLLYTFIAKNTYLGIGSFWSPYFSPNLWPVFSEHPSMGFNLISLTYYLFGDFGYNGEVFFLGMFPLLMWGFWRLFKIVKIMEGEASESYGSHFWLFVVMFISMPLIQSVYQKGFLENIMAPFMVGAVVFFILSEQNSKGRDKLLFRRILYFFIANLLVVIGLLIKGPTGLFPLAVPFFYVMFIDKVNKSSKGSQESNWRRWGEGLFYSFLAGVVTLSMLIFLCLVVPEAKESLSRYLVVRMGDAGVDHYSWEVIRRALKTFLVNELSRPLFVVLLIFFIFKIPFFSASNNVVKSKSLRLEWMGLSSNLRRWIKFLFAISFSAYLPLFVSPKINGQYITLSLPYATMAMFLFILPLWDKQVKIFFSDKGFKRNTIKVDFKKWISIGVLVPMFIFTTIFVVNLFSNSSELVDSRDIRKIKPFLSTLNKVPLCPNLRDPTGYYLKDGNAYVYGYPWLWHIHFKEQLGVDLVFTEGKSKYMLGVQSDRECGFQRPNYEELDLGLEKYRLFKLKD